MTDDSSMKTAERPLGLAVPQKLTRGSLVMTATKLVVVFIAYLLNAYLARALGPASFGLFGAVVTALAWLELAVAEGLPTWVARETDHVDDLHRALPRRYLTWQLVLSLALTVMMFLASPWIARWMGAPDSANLFRIASVDIPIYGLYVLVASVLLGAGLYTANAATNVAYYIAKFGFTLAFVSGGLAAVGAVLGSLSASVAGLAIAMLLLSVAMRRSGSDKSARTTSTQAPAKESSTGDVVRGSVTPAVLLLFQALMLSVPLWLLRGLAPEVQSGYYRAASLIAQVPIDIAAGFTWALFSAYSTAHKKGDQAKCRHYISQSVRLIGVAAILWTAVVLPTTHPLLSLLFSSTYASGGPTLIILTLGLLVGIFALVLAPTLIVRGNARALLVGAGVLVAVQVVAISGLAAQMGSLGAAVATGGVLALAGGGVLLLVHSDIAPSVWGSLARTVPGGVAACAVGFTLQVSSPVGLIWAYPAMALVFFVVAWLTRGMTRDDLSALREGL